MKKILHSLGDRIGRTIIGCSAWRWISRNHWWQNDICGFLLQTISLRGFVSKEFPRRVYFFRVSSLLLPKTLFCHCVWRDTPKSYAITTGGIHVGYASRSCEKYPCMHACTPPHAHMATIARHNMGYANMVGGIPMHVVTPIPLAEY